MAQNYARSKELDEVIILNASGRIAEGSYQNFFLVKDNIIYTPPISEGCIDGACRRWIIELLKGKIELIVSPIEVFEIENADEIFFSTAVRGVRIADLSKENQVTNQVKKILLESI
jgi:branched-chain amino acid aminotransferase